MNASEAEKVMEDLGGMFEFVDVSGIAFRGVVTAAHFSAFNYYGKTPSKDNRATGLFVKVWIEPNADTPDKVKEINSQMMPLVISAGTSCRPSRDTTPKGPSYEKVPVDMSTGNDEDQTGPYFTGGKIAKSSNFPFFFLHAAQAGFDLTRARNHNIEETLVGVEANWITVPQPTRDIEENEKGGYKFKRDGSETRASKTKKTYSLLVMDGGIAYDVDVSAFGAQGTSAGMDNSVAVDLIVKVLDGHPMSKDNVINTIVAVTSAPEDDALQGFVLGKMTPDWLSAQSVWSFVDNTLTPA